MKSYANFILMENLLYNVPRDVLSIATLSDILINPRVKIVERSCDTSLGTPFDPVFLNSAQPADRNGQVLTPYGYTMPVLGPLGPTQVPPFTTTTELSVDISNGVRKKYVYHPASCNSVGGICSICAYSAYLYSTARVIKTSPASTTEYYNPPQTYNNMAPVLQVGSSMQIQLGYGKSKGFMSPSQKSLFSWLANTYSGSLLGIRNFSNFPLPVSTQLYRSLLNKNLVAQAQSDLSQMSSVPSDVLSYIETLEDILEKALLIVVVYTIYGSRYSAPVTDAPTITV